MSKDKDYEILPINKNFEGKVRRVGFELEFAGLTLQQAVNVVLETYEGNLKSSTQAEKIITVNSLGEFSVEIDWTFLKQQAEQFKQENKDDQWLGYVGQLATMVVPLEIVCPPIDWHAIDKLESMIITLRRHGAEGTEHSLLAAYGLHINTEVASLETFSLYSYLKAFTFLQGWLVEYHQINFTRKITPYIELFTDDYIAHLCKETPSSIDDLIENYLKYNNTRNRALDMLPVFKYIRPETIEETTEDERIKARPTFHYRLPDCKINRDNWGVARAWNGWCLVERLANNESALDQLTREYINQRRAMTGVNRKTWLEVLKECIEHHELG